MQNPSDYSTGRGYVLPHVQGHPDVGAIISEQEKTQGMKHATEIGGSTAYDYILGFTRTPAPDKSKTLHARQVLPPTTCCPISGHARIGRFRQSASASAIISYALALWSFMTRPIAMPIRVSLSTVYK
ncbi:hypothetical protein PIB30_015064 [Stylosanthes scabra]|uniref:Uncharacterized protein n=1 Tax=Stylosanthes scabra TaxID=79078 RepID=A0ABU6Q7L9_9FABA|nr:hypothetical protein [Stylosanthes scabra]